MQPQLHCACRVPTTPTGSLPAAPRCRQAKEITNNVAPEPFRWTVEGMLALQEATEDFIVRPPAGCGWMVGAGPACRVQVCV